MKRNKASAIAKQIEPLLDKSPTTQLIEAVIAGDKNAAQRALELGADLNGGGLYNRGSSLYHASELKSDAMVRWLLGQGANPNTRNHVGYAPLHVAAQMGRLDTCARLIDAGADVNARCVHGTTPLHWACTHHDSKRTIVMLLQAGADPNTLGTIGGRVQSPMGVALSSSVRDGALILRHFGGNVPAKDRVRFESRWDGRAIMSVPLPAVLAAAGATELVLAELQNGRLDAKASHPPAAMMAPWEKHKDVPDKGWNLVQWAKVFAHEDTAQAIAAWVARQKTLELISADESKAQGPDKSTRRARSKWARPAQPHEPEA